MFDESKSLIVVAKQRTRCQSQSYCAQNNTW